MSAESNQVANSATPNAPKKRGRPKKEAPLPAVVEESRPSSDRLYPKGVNRRGFNGECVRVKINRNPHEAGFGNLVVPSCGELPKFGFRVNVPVVMPIELFNTLRDTAVEIPSSGTCGPDDVRQTETVVRIPYQYLGSATWEDFEAFLAENRPKALNASKNR